LQEDYGASFDEVETVLASTPTPLDALVAIHERMKRLKALTQETTPPETLQAIVEPANRIEKMLGQAALLSPSASLPDPQYFTESEAALWDTLQKGQDDPSELVAWQAPITRVFDSVMIQDPDLAVRENRIRLLSVALRAYRRLYGNLSLLKG
jgi:glycyl-tRNA synthetase beta subunit